MTTVTKGEELIWADTAGVPGVTYTYTVRTYLDTENGRVYSENAGAQALFPPLEAPINLTGTPATHFNRVLLQWSHRYDSHDFFRIERNGETVGTVDCGEDQFFHDTTGVPSLLYNYEVTAVMGNYESQPATVELNYPGVEEVQNLQANIPAFITNTCNYPLGSELGFVNSNQIRLTFDYEDGQADGFEIYRDGDQIDTIAGNKRMYDDFTGEPGTTYTYKVRAFVNRGETPSFSGVDALIPSASETFPDLFPFSSLTATKPTGEGNIKLEITYDLPGADGFYIKREKVGSGIVETIATLNGTTPLEEPLVFYDRTGIPNPVTTYEYSVESFTTRNGNPYTSQSGCTITLDYPPLPVPQNLTASDGTFFNYVEISWEYDDNVGIDSFELVNTTNGIFFTIENGARVHKELFSTIPEEKDQIYRMRSLKEIDGSTYYSEWSDNGGG